jgi:hypothetical protein
MPSANIASHILYDEKQRSPFARPQRKSVSFTRAQPVYETQLTGLE